MKAATEATGPGGSKMEPLERRERTRDRRGKMEPLGQRSDGRWREQMSYRGDGADMAPAGADGATGAIQPVAVTSWRLPGRTEPQVLRPAVQHKKKKCCCCFYSKPSSALKCQLVSEMVLTRHAELLSVLALGGRRFRRLDFPVKWII